MISPTGGNLFVIGVFLLLLSNCHGSVWAGMSKVANFMLDSSSLHTAHP